MSLAGVEATTQQSRFHADLNPDVKHIDLLALNLSVDSYDLLSDAHLSLKEGTSYGLVGRNGTGKSTLLRVIAEGKLVGFPPSVTVQYVAQEAVGDDRSILQTLLDANAKRAQAIADVHALEAALEADEQGEHTGHGAHNAVASNAAASSTATEGGSNCLISVVHGIQCRRAGLHAEAADLVAAKRSGRRGQSARREAVAAAAAAERMRGLALTQEQATEAAHTILTELYEQLADMDAEAEEARACAILAGLGFKAEQQDLPTRCLSGGWRMRLALATALFAQPELLLLDEPTNHLDLRSTLWLAQYLHGTRESAAGAGAGAGSSSSSSRQQTIVIVSHDRTFLSMTTDETITLKDKQLLYFPGPYNAMAAAKAEAQVQQARQADKLNRKQERVQESIDNALKAARSAGDDKRLGQVASRRKKLEERMGLEKAADGRRFKLNQHLIGYFESRRPQLQLDKPEKEVTFKLPELDDLRYQGPLLQLRNISYRYAGATSDTLTDVTMDFALGCRVGIVGANGAGKSTLLSVIRGALQPTSGSVERFHRLRLSFYTQHQAETLEPSSTPLALVMARASASGTPMREQEARDYLGGFNVPGSLPATECRLLSGGQRCRVALALLMWDRPHLLLMDEPTNHLDHETIEGLSRALSAFPGGVVVASHDVTFLREVLGSDTDDGDDGNGVSSGVLYVVKQAGHSVRRYDGGIDAYVEELMASVERQRQQQGGVGLSTL